MNALCRDWEGLSSAGPEKNVRHPQDPHHGQGSGIQPDLPGSAKELRGADAPELEIFEALEAPEAEGGQERPKSQGRRFPIGVRYAENGAVRDPEPHLRRRESGRRERIHEPSREAHPNLGRESEAA